MIISAMLDREDFYKILIETLEFYYNKTQNKNVKVSYDKFKDSDELFIYPRLSYISRRITPSGAKKFLYSEYNIRNSFIKYLCGKLMVFLGTHTFGLGASKKIYISNDIVGKNEFISPQNRSVRIFNYETLTVDCVAKSGFTDFYFNNQLKFREDCNYDFVPKLLEHGERWFRERIMLGHALARVTVEEDYKKAVSDVLLYLRIIANDTMVFITADKYVAMLAEEIKEKLSRAVNNKKIKYVAQLIEETDKIVQKTLTFDFTVPLVTSHGDLQSGNIWVDKEKKTWIYDWETVKQRSVWYDCATLLYSIRRAGGLENLINSNDISEIYVCDNRSDYSADETYVIKTIVLLEDILFYLDDMNGLPFEYGNDIFDKFSLRVLNILKGNN